jgi:aspartate-semialdehyde dehydrogenase
MLISKNIAIVGVTGQVGQVLLKILAAKNFPASQLRFVASERSAGKQIHYQNQALTVEDIASFDFSKVDLAFFAAGSEVAKHYAPIAANAGCIVIDKSSYFRMDPAVPLVVPEVNGYLLKNSPSKIFAVPNCSTIPLVMALKPLHDLAIVERVEVATYQAVSGAGIKGVKALEDEIKSFKNSDINEYDNNKVPQLGFPIAFNIIPKIDDFLPSGYTKEEMKMTDETKKILSPEILVNATAVRVPVWQGHSEAVHLRTVKPLEVAAATQALKDFPGIQFCEAEIPMPFTHAANNPIVWLGRLRRHPQDSAHYLSFWLTCDNLYKGAAYNALQIAEKLFDSLAKNA